MATLYKTDGDVIAVYPANGKAFSLEELQKYVGGYIEMVWLGDNMNLICNEEGKLMGLPANLPLHRAYQIYNDIIVGDVVICNDVEAGSSDEEDEEHETDEDEFDEEGIDTCPFCGDIMGDNQTMCDSCEEEAFNKPGGWD